MFSISASSLRLMCVILSTIYAYAEDQCGRDVHGCLVVSRASDTVAGLAVLTAWAMSRCGAFACWTGGCRSGRCHCASYGFY